MFYKVHLGFLWVNRSFPSLSLLRNHLLLVFPLIYTDLCFRIPLFALVLKVNTSLHCAVVNLLMYRFPTCIKRVRRNELGIIKNRITYELAKLCGCISGCQQQTRQIIQGVTLTQLNCFVSFHHFHLLLFVSFLSSIN